MTSHSDAPARLMRIVAIAMMIAMLAMPAMAAPAAPTAANPVTTVTLVSPTTAVPFYLPAGQPANFNITYDAGGPGVSGTGQQYYQIGAVLGTTGAIASLPVAGGTIPVALNAGQTLAGSYDVQVCARAIDQIGWTCSTQLNAVKFLAGAPNTPVVGPRWPMHGETLIDPNKPGGFYDVLESIPSPAPPNPTFLVRWDALKAQMNVPLANRAPTPIRLELWDATDYNAVPPDCYLDSQVMEGPGGIPNQMLLRWSSAWANPLGLPNTGNFTWAVPPTLGSCFMMRLVYTDLAGQTGWDWSGPVPTGATTDPDPLTGRFQITAYDLTAPNVTWQSPVANACLGLVGTAPNRKIGPFTVAANDPESGIDWVFFQAQWPVGQVSAPFPAPPTPWSLDYLLYTQPDPPGTYTGFFPASVTWPPPGTKFDVEATARNMAGNTTSQKIADLVWADPDNLQPFVFDPTCSALNPTCQPSSLGYYSFIGGDRQIKGTVAENWFGEVATVHFSWQPIDLVTAAPLGSPIPIGDGVRTVVPPPSGPQPVPSEWTLDWDTTLFPDGPGYIIAVVENCAGATMTSDSKGVNQCSTYILNVGPTCETDAIQAPAFGDTWQIGQGHQWTLPPMVLGGNANGLVLWDPNKIQGVFPNTTPAFPGGAFPFFSAGPISNIEVSWDNGGHWFRILMDPGFWSNDAFYQTSLAPGATSYAGYPWLYVHGRPNQQLSWRVRLTATDVAGNQCQTESRPFNVFGREEQVGTGCGPTFPTSTAWPAAIAPPLGTCVWVPPVASFLNPSPFKDTQVMNVSAWDPQTGISKVDFCYQQKPVAPALVGNWVCPYTTDVPRALQGSFSGPYNYRAAFDTNIITNDPLAGDGPTDFKAKVCNGVGMCVDSTIVRRVMVDNTAPTIVNMWPRSYQTIATMPPGITPEYCAMFSPSDPPADLTGPVTTEFEYRVFPAGIWLPAGRYDADPTKDTNGFCASTQGRLPPNLPGNAVPQSWPDGAVVEVRAKATDGVGNTSAWLTHYQIKVDNQFPDAIYQINLNKGWNLISLPLPPAQPAITPAQGVKHGVLKDLFDAQSAAPAASPFTFRVDAYGNPLAPPPGYGAPNGWTVYDSAGLQTLMMVPAGPGYWVKVSAPVTLFNFGIYPPRPGDLPQVYEAGKNWNLLGYTDATGIPSKTIDAYFGENLMNLNPPGPTAIYQYTTSYSIPAVLNLGRGYWVAYLNGRTITP